MSTPTAQEIRAYLEKHGIQAALTGAVNAAIQSQAPNALEFIGDKLKSMAGGSSGGAELIDISSLTVVAKELDDMLPQPGSPTYKTALINIYVRDAPFGGSDKSSNGCRYDYIPFVNGMIGAGMSCQVIHYLHEEHDKFFDVVKNFDALIVRCNPGQIKADGGSQEKFDEGMRKMLKLGIQVWPSPDVMEFMGAKDALTNIKDLSIGLPDTLSYYEEAAFIEGFKKTMAFQPRVIKQNRGSSGEGIWIIKLKSGNYCEGYGDRMCSDDEVLELMEVRRAHRGRGRRSEDGDQRDPWLRGRIHGFGRVGGEPFR